MGKIIVIEGTDGCGKETQSKNLFQKLTSLGYDVKRQSFPNYGSASSGPLVMYLNCELSNKADDLDAYQSSVLFAADRLCTMLAYKNFLAKPNSVLILDRYVESNLIHQACKIQNSADRLKFINWINKFEYGTLQLPKPDLVFFLDMPTEYSQKLAQSRKEYKSGAKKDIHEKDGEYMKRAYSTGKQVAKMCGWEIIDCVENQNIKE